MCFGFWLTLFSVFRENKLKKTNKKMKHTKQKQTQTHGQRDKIRCMRFSSIVCPVYVAIIVELCTDSCLLFFFLLCYFFLSSSSSRLLFPPLVNLLIAYFSKQFDALRVLRLLFHSFVLLSCQFFFGFINFRLFRAFFNFDCICIRPVSPNAFPFISHLWL